MVRVVDSALRTLDRIRRIPIRYTNDGRFVELTDIAEVNKGIVQPPSSLALIDGKPAIVLGTLVRSKFRVDHWTTALNQNLAEFSDDLPKGVRLKVLYEQNRYVASRMATLLRNLIRQLQSELNEALPEARGLVRQLEQGPPFSAPIEMRLVGPDLDVLRELGNQIRRILAETPEVVHTRATLAETVPTLAVQVDEQQARLAGLDHAAVARQLDVALEGTVGGTMLETTEELPVRVRVDTYGIAESRSFWFVKDKTECAASP